MDNKFIVGIPYSGCEYISEIPCTSEAEAVAVACGAWLGGKECLVFMQDAGFLSALNVIIGLAETYGIKIDSYVKFIKEPEHHRLTFEMARYVYDTLRGNKTDFGYSNN